MPNGITEDKYGVGRDKAGNVKYMRGTPTGLKGEAVGRMEPVKNAAGMAGDSDPGYYPKSDPYPKSNPSMNYFHEDDGK